MNTKDETNEQSVVIKDLSAVNAEEVKGGADRDKFESYLQLTLTNSLVS